MRIIGLTGGSGTGKGTFAALLRDKGAGWVDADAVYRALCAENRDMLHQLDTTFDGVLDETGALNRPKLARIVFADPAKLQKLNEITLPYIRAASLDAMRAQGDCPFVLYDAPTLFEAGVDDLCECIIGVLADTEVRVQRIMARDGLDEQAARAASARSRTRISIARDAITLWKTTATLPTCSDRPTQFIKIYAKETEL